MARTSKKVEQAYQEAQDLYKGLINDSGEDVFSFINNVYSFCRSENEKLVALLSLTLSYQLISEHDLLYTYGSTVTEAVKYLTKNEDETNEEFLSRLKLNPISRAVKISEYKYLLSISKIDQDEFDARLNVLIS